MDAQRRANTSIPMPTNHSRVKLRAALEDVRWRARWRAHDAAVAVEEDVVWRGADTVRELAERTAESPVGRGAKRMRWLLDRRLLWPITDRLGEQSELARTAIATGGVIVALGAASTGALLSAGSEPRSVSEPQTVAAATGAVGDTLEGVSPSFTSHGKQGSAPVKAEGPPGDPVARTAWEFAQAFVLYEIGQADDAADDFERLATPALARSLGESPPRLPADVPVPKARVLNVVVGEPKAGDPAAGAPRDGRGETLVDASVSLVRLQAVSELRLTLRRDGKSWRVTEIRG